MNTFFGALSLLLAVFIAYALAGGIWQHRKQKQPRRIVTQKHITCIGGKWYVYEGEHLAVPIPESDGDMWFEYEYVDHKLVENNHYIYDSGAWTRFTEDQRPLEVQLRDAFMSGWVYRSAEEGLCAEEGLMMKKCNAYMKALGYEQKN